MPMTPTMRKANEKNAKNVTKRGNVSKTSKKGEGYPVSPELIVSIFKLNSPPFISFSSSSYVRLCAKPSLLGLIYIEKIIIQSN